MDIGCSFSYTHNIYIYKEHRNLEIRKHLRLPCSGTKLFITFDFKRFFDIRRETQSYYAVLFIWPPSRAASRRVQIRLFRRASESRASRSASSFKSLTSLKSPKSSVHFRCVTSFALHHPFLFSGYCVISE